MSLISEVLDVGSGPGKFCVVAGVREPTLSLHGIEQRPRLVRLSERLARQFGTTNVRFSAGDATLADWARYDGFYFFNPFTSGERKRLGDRGDSATIRFDDELVRAEALLLRAGIGTVVVTYHGFGGAIPASYELIADERAGTDRLRTWVRRSHHHATWAWLEMRSSIVRVAHRDVHSVLASWSWEHPDNDRRG